MSMFNFQLSPSVTETRGNNSASYLRIVTAVAFVICVLYASTVRLSGDDFWLQAKIGEIIANSNEIPDTLLFPFTEIVFERFNAHEWLISVVFHYALTFLGQDGMPFLIGGLGLALFTVMARLTFIRTHGNFSLALLGGYLSVLVENYRHVLRPELPCLIIMALLLCNLETFKTRPNLRSGFWSCLLIVIWANSHGSFILGPLLIGIFATGQYIDEIRAARFKLSAPSSKVFKLTLLFAAALGSCLINPFGMELIQFVFSFSMHSDASKNLTEWLPTFDHRMYGVRGFWIALGTWTLLAFFLLVGRARVGGVEWLIFIAFSILAFRAIRFPVYLGMVAAYILPICLPSSWLLKKWEPRILTAGLALALSSIAMVSIYGNAGRNSTYSKLDSIKFTIPMVQALGNPALRGNVLNTMELGAELIYLTYPRMRPSMDCRVDSYGFEYGNFNSALFNNDELLREFVGRYDVRYLLMDTRQFERFGKLSSMTDGEWRIYFGDTRAVLLQRADILEGSPSH
jgi:hypothetical protein